jgi:N,N'-diacetyllegionaminate synthase
MNQPITIVAEAAQGFEGSAVKAQLLVRAAAAAGAGAVKFQLVYADELAVPGYQYFDLFRTLEMSDADWRTVADEASRLGIALAFDVYGPRSLALGVALGARAIKIHSTDFFNAALVDAAIATGLDIWFSVGGITLDEIHDFLKVHAVRRPDQLTLLYGFQAEPTAIEDNHLRRLTTLRQTFPSLQLGFMDHADGLSDEAGWLGVLALPFGITVIEKHLTIGRALNLEDAVSALDATDFAAYVRRVRAAERALGDAGVQHTAQEQRYRQRALKTVVAARDIAAGATIGEADVMLKRAAPSDAAPYFRISDVAGAVTRHRIAAGDAVRPDHLS